MYRPLGSFFLNVVNWKKLAWLAIFLSYKKSEIVCFSSTTWCESSEFAVGRIPSIAEFRMQIQDLMSTGLCSVQ